LKCISDSKGFNLVVADDQTSYGYPAYSDGSISDCNSADQNPADGVLTIEIGCVDCDSDGMNDDLDNCPANPNTNQADADGDGIGDVCDSCTDIDGDGFGNPGFPSNACPLDNCPDTYNVAQADADADCMGDVCDPEPEAYDSSVPDVYPPQGNGIGDACDCEGNFNCAVDPDVDGSDAALFKADFGRSVIIEPCTNEAPCNGDFNCDGDADGTDAALFKQDFGRSSFKNPCPVSANGVEWCSYPLP
jgi:hypothetical protein